MSLIPRNRAINSLRRVSNKVEEGKSIAQLAEHVIYDDGSQVRIFFVAPRRSVKFKLEELIEQLALVRDLVQYRARCPQSVGSPRLIPRADRRPALAEAGEFPHASAGRIDIGRDIDVDEIRPVGLDALAHRFREIGGAIDAHTFDAGRARHSGEVRIVAL